MNSGLAECCVEEGEQRVALGRLEPVDVGGEARVHEQRPLAGLGVGAHDRVLDRLERRSYIGLALPLALAAAVEQLAELGRAVVDGGERRRGTPAAPG